MWRAYGINPVTSVRAPFYGSTKEEAEQKAANSFGILQHPDTLFAFYDRFYLPTIIPRSENWKNQVFWAMDKYVLPTFGNVPIEEIKRPELQVFFNKILHKMKVSSVQKIRICFSGVLNLAVADGKIPSNPCQFVKLPTAEEPDKTALTFEQLARVYQAAKPELKVAILLSACAGGLRIGEVCGTSRMLLTSENVLLVRQQVLQLPGGSTVTPKLKTLQTKRDLPLPAGLAEAIREHSQGRFYLAGTNRNKHQLPNKITEWLALACESAGVEKITPHELRHTFISLLENELEAPAPIVAALAGRKHKAVSKMTGGYSHTQRDQLKRWLTIYWERFENEVSRALSETQSETQSA